jgi:NAD(P)-dependent dehydrogenase (short-subunit alcohol dehydrogenase family)
VAGRLSGKVALVTGAARGQGAAEAELFCREGARVVLTDVRATEGEHCARALRDAGHEAIYRHLDVSSGADWDAAIGDAEAEFASLDILINNAGIVGFSGVSDSSDEEWSAGARRQPDRRLCQRLLDLRRQLSRCRRGACCATRRACREMTRAAAIDLAPHGIRVNCVLPVLSSPT